MKHVLLVAFLALGGAACEDHPKPGTGDAGADGEAEAQPAPDAFALPDRQPDLASAPDLAVDAGADASEPAPDGAIDAGAADLGADAMTTPGDAAADGLADAGGETCGAASREMLCTSYCDGAGRFCTGSSQQYRDAAECRAACNGPAWTCGKAGETTGNTLYCRLAHLTLAGLGAAAKECPNAGPRSAACQ